MDLAQPLGGLFHRRRLTVPASLRRRLRFKKEPYRTWRVRSRPMLNSASRFSAGLADSEIVVFFQCRGLSLGEGVAAKFGWGQAGFRFEGAIERPDRLKSG